MPIEDHINCLKSQFFPQLEMNYKGNELDAAKKVSIRVFQWTISSNGLQENIIEWSGNKIIILNAQYKTSCKKYEKIIVSVSAKTYEIEIPFKKRVGKSPLYLIDDKLGRQEVINRLEFLGIEGKGKKLKPENRFKIPFMSVVDCMDDFCEVLNLIIEKIKQEEEKDDSCQRQVSSLKIDSKKTIDFENITSFREVEEINNITNRIENEDWKEEDFEDSRKRIEQSIVQRQGQPQFREKLLKEYSRKCVITGCDAEQVLEAAHIRPYVGEESNQVENGLLLRADIHTLFDRYLITIDPKTYKICIAPKLMETTYRSLNEKFLNIHEGTRPNPKYLRYHYNIALQQWITKS